MAKRKRAPSPSPSPDPTSSPEPSVSPEPSPSPQPAKRQKKAAVGKGKAASSNTIPKSTKGAKPAVSKKKAKETVKDDAPAGFKTWMTTTQLTSGGKLSKTESQFNPASTRFTQVVEVHNSDAFTLKPLTITEGPLKGRHVLMLEPVTPSDYFRFLDLPPELRRMVYDLLLEETEGISIDTHKPVGLARRPVRSGFRYKSKEEKRDQNVQWDKLQGKWVGQARSNVSLLRVSKQLTEETAPVVYGNHAFSFHKMSAALIFLQTIGNMVQYLRHLKLSERGYMTSKARPIFNLLKKAKDLRTLTLDHQAVCTNELWYGHRTVSLEGLISDSMPMLRALHDGQKEDASKVDVRDIIEIIKAQKCSECERGRGKCLRSPGRHLCEGLDTHNEKNAADIKTLVAKRLGIKQ